MSPWWRFAVLLSFVGPCGRAFRRRKLGYTAALKNVPTWPALAIVGMFTGYVVLSMVKTSATKVPHGCAEHNHA